MTTFPASTGAAEQTVRHHRVRGAIYGLLLGFSAAIYLVLFAVVPFGDWLPLALAVVVGIVIGVLWASFAPSRGPKEAAPIAVEPQAPIPTEGDTPPPAAAPLGADALETDAAVAADVDTRPDTAFDEPLPAPDVDASGGDEAP